MIKVALMLALTGCAHPLPTGMVVTETHYTDAQEIYSVCAAEACVFTDQQTFCDMHLPLAANGDPMHREHELMHCGGHVDSPRGGS